MSSTNELKQLELNLTIVTEVEDDGVGMGVLSNGTPYLTGRGLARLCGISNSNIGAILDDWQSTPPKKRVQSIRKIIRESGHDDTQAFISIEMNGVIHHAFPEHVCMSILEYYAIDSPTHNEHARVAFRTLAKKGFTDFVYERVGLRRDPTPYDLLVHQFMDRVSLVNGAVPVGFFSVFDASAQLFATLIQHGISVDSSFIPDISIGRVWSKYWDDENLNAVYGRRERFEHQYPSYYPQSAAGPQEAYCYPEDALGEYRKWMREVYLKDKLPNYLKSKISSGAIDQKTATQITESYNPKTIAK